jgi:hypothetical protein
LTTAELTAIEKDVQTIWSQAGIKLKFTSAPISTTNIGVFNARNDGTGDKLVTKTNNTPQAIDVYLVHSIWDTDTEKKLYYMNGLTVTYQRDHKTPGVIIGLFRPGSHTEIADPAGPWGTRRPLSELARTLAHELGHYLSNSASHKTLADGADELWNLMVNDGDGRHRDLDSSQVQNSRTTMDPLSPDKKA